MYARLIVLAMASVLVALDAGAEITDFRSWTIAEDPEHPGFSAAVALDGSVATLMASDQSIPSGTDIGYQSVNGSRPSTSTSGFLFRPDEDFSLAIDYSWSFSSNASGILALGFGIGEDADGMNSAGVVMFAENGIPLGPFGGAARVSDENETPLFLGNPLTDTSSLAGTMFVEYEASSGDITLGASPTTGAATPLFMDSYDGIQKRWSGTDLMASFFIRSDDTLGTIWNDGSATATFSNLRVVGNPIAIPEPSMALASGCCVCSILLFRTRRRRGRSRFHERV